MPDEQHPEWWYTAVYVKREVWTTYYVKREVWTTYTVWAVYAQRHEKSDGFTDMVLARFHAEEPAEQFVAFWNETHAAPGAPLVEDAGEVGAFLDEKPGDE